FNNISEKGLDGQAGNAEPVVQIPDAAQGGELDRVRREIQAHEDALPKDKLEILQNDWEKTGSAELPLPPRSGLLGHYEFDAHLADTSGFYHHARTLRGYVTFGR